MLKKFLLFQSCAVLAPKKKNHKSHIESGIQNCTTMDCVYLFLEISYFNSII